MDTQEIAEEKALNLVKICGAEILQELEGVIGEPHFVARCVVHDAVVSRLASQVRAQPSPNTVLGGFAHSDVYQTRLNEGIRYPQRFEANKVQSDHALNEFDRTFLKAIVFREGDGSHGPAFSKTGGPE